MPNAPLQICRDCQKVALPGSRYCRAHIHTNRAIERSREIRASGCNRFYDSAQWRKRTVPFVLRRDPLCTIRIVCGGRAASTDVDHIIRAEEYIAAHAGDPLVFYDVDNLRGACHADHSKKTVLENAGKWSEKLIPRIERPTWLGRQRTGGG